MFNPFRGRSAGTPQPTITGGITMPLSEVHRTLQGYTEEERQKILDSISTLAVTAQFMGGDFRMKVLLNKPGAGWSWNFKHNEVLVDPETILKSPPYVSKATYCHEGFHRRITPGSIIPESNLQKLGYLFLVNCIEDCRIENFGADAYPSYRPVRDKAYAYNTKQLNEAWQKAVVKPPYHTAAGLELIRQWFREERADPKKFRPQRPRSRLISLLTFCLIARMRGGRSQI